MTKQAVLYARVCVDDGQNLAEQLERCRQYAQAHDWQVVEELAEPGVSGNTLERPQLNRMLELARAGKFGVLVVYEPNRLSRDLTKLLAVEAKVRQHGIEIEYISPAHSEAPGMLQAIEPSYPPLVGDGQRAGKENHQKEANTMTKRAVLYARVSGDDRGKDGRNLEGQLDMCREYAQQNDWPIVAEMAEDDRGASGASFELPQLDRVREMASKDEFEVLVVREIDRLSRNLAKQLIVEEELKRTGVQIEYALAEYPDTPEGRLNKHIRATIAEYEREKITERMTRGRRLKVRAGNVIAHGRPPYGYRLEEVDGKRMLVIHEPEARIVRLVFEWFVYGDESGKPLSMRSITRKLEGTPTRGDTDSRQAKKRRYGQWAQSTIAGMLKNETYAGVWRYSKNRGKRTAPAIEDQATVQVPAIVSRKVWDAAQERRAENRRICRRNRKYRYLLSGRLTCGECGARIIGHTYTDPRYKKNYAYYHCPVLNLPEHYPGHTCSGMRFRVDHVEEVVWDWIKSLLIEPQKLKDGLAAQKEKQDEENAPIRERLGVVDDLLAENRRQQERLLDLYLSNDFPKEALMDRRGRLETTIEALEKERTNLLVHLETRTLTAEQIQTIEDFAVKMGKGLTAADTDDSFEARQQILEQLHFQGIMAIEDGEKVVHACCIMGEKVLYLASNSTKTGTDVGSPCRDRPYNASRTNGLGACVY